MNLLRFEMKKTLKQKKYIWAFLVVFLITGAMFWMNSFQRSKLQGNWARYQAAPSINIRVIESERLRKERSLVRKREDVGLNNQEEKQLVYLEEMGHALQRLRIFYNFGRWTDSYRFEKIFLDNLENYSRVGGELLTLEGMDRELAIARNQWFTENDISYEVERAPISQHLFLKESSSLILGIVGIIVLVVLFGNTMIEEKEHSTWQTLNTQPISKTKLVVSKYITLILMGAIFILMVVIAGLLIPFIFEGWTLNLKYPHIFTSEDSFLLISTGQYLLRNIILFFCGSIFILSISLMVSKWVKKSLSFYFLMGIIVVLGYISTLLLPSPLNPFYFLNIDSSLGGPLSENIILYVVSMLIWACIFIISTIYLPEVETKTSQSNKDNKPFDAGETHIRGKKIWSICIFEWRKLMRQGTLRTLAVTMTVIVFTGFAFLSYQTKENQRQYIEELNWRAMGEQLLYYEEMLEESFERIKEIEEEYSEGSYDYDFYMGFALAQIAWLEELIAEAIEQEDLVKGAIKGYEEGDWLSFYKYQLYLNEKAFNDTYNSGRYLAGYETIRRFTKLVSIHEKELLMERNLQPVLSGEFIPTMHQYWGGQTRIGWRGEVVRRSEWERQNKKVDNSGLFSLYLSFTSYFYLLPMAAMVFFLGGGMAKEKGKKMTFNFLKTQPLTEEKIFIGKVINSLFFVFLVSLITPFLLLGVGTIFNRLGDWNYPILHYFPFSESMSSDFSGYMAGGHGYTFVNLGKYLINCTVLFIAMSVLLIGISNLLSIFINRTLGVWVATIIICIGGFWYNGRHSLRISYLSPYTYFNIPKISDGQLATRINDPRVNVITGFMVMMIVAILCVALGYWLVYQKKLDKSKIYKKTTANVTIQGNK